MFLNRIPIRARLTVVFGFIMLTIFVTTGLFLQLRFRSEVDTTINQSLRTRAADISAFVREADSELSEAGKTNLAKHSEEFSQVIDETNTVIDATPQVNKSSLLDREDFIHTKRSTLIKNYQRRQPLHGPVRILATSVVSHNHRFVVVVGVSLKARNQTLGKLRDLLIFSGCIALILTAAAGYGVATAALNPVEIMRRRAANISSHDSHQQLPVPLAKDEIQRLGITLNEMLTRLQQAFEHERRFFADASHELRTPLAILRAELELATHGKRSPAELEAALQSSIEETDRLITLTNDLLALAREEEGKVSLQYEHLEVQELFERIKNRFANRSSTEERPLRISVIPPDLSLDLDVMRMEQALSNMVDNAFRYGEGVITLSASVAATNVCIEVRDQGKGFSYDLLPQAFERFSREAAVQQRSGTGLGLSIVQAIARSHGGEAHIEQPVFGETNVFLEIPQFHSGHRPTTSAE